MPLLGAGRILASGEHLNSNFQTCKILEPEYYNIDVSLISLSLMSLTPSVGV